MGNFCGMTANDVFCALFDLGILRHTKIQPLLKLKQISQFKCQDCGYYYDECVCYDNEIIVAIKKLEKEKICCK